MIICKTIQQLLSESFQNNYKKVAIEYNMNSFTYEYIDSLSENLADKLSKRFQPFSVVLLYFQEKLNYIIGLLAVLKSRNIFINIDTNYPSQKIESLFNYKIDCIISEKSYESLLNLNNVPPICIFDYRNCNKINQIIIKKKIAYNVDDPIYIYFTSGTTSLPKAIIGKNESLSHFISWEVELLKVNDSFKVSLLTSPSFDPYLRDVLVPLCSGSKICIPTSKTMVNIGKLSKWIEEAHIDLIHCTPSLFNLFTIYLTKTKLEFSSLKYVVLAGEKISVKYLLKWKNMLGDRVVLINAYGPTETTLFKAYHYINNFDIDKGEIPIGTPIKDVYIYIMNANGKECIDGEVGEIYISTQFMSLGYYMNDSLNETVFVKNPHIEGLKMYKTGDLGRIEGGLIYYNGRKDRQIKKDGNRIELDEIENIFNKIDVVRACAVVYSEENNRIILYYSASKPLANKFIREYLLPFLPFSALPNDIILLDELPITKNKKTDYALLQDKDFYIKQLGHISSV